VRDYIHEFYYNNDYSTIAKTYLKHAFSMIAVKLRLLMSKTNKKKNKIGEKFTR